jgi:hypothetical protein
MTDKEATEIGNVAFRLLDPLESNPMGGDPYYSKKWKLHLFEDKHICEKIAIVDELTPLEHIDNLWSKDGSLYHTSNDTPFIPDPQYDWIEIDRYLVVSHFLNKDLDLFYKRKRKLLTARCQFDIFEKLQRFGFFGEAVVLH